MFISEHRKLCISRANSLVARVRSDTMQMAFLVARTTLLPRFPFRLPPELARGSSHAWGGLNRARCVAHVTLDQALQPSPSIFVSP